MNASTETDVRILHLSSDAAELAWCRAALDGATPAVTLTSVSGLEPFRDALIGTRPHLVLCTLNETDQLALRAMVLTRAAYLDLPFIVIDRGASDPELRDRIQQAATAVVEPTDGEAFARRVIEISQQVPRADQSGLLLRALEQTPASIMLTNRSGQIIYVNQRFCDTSGYTAEEVLGRNPRFLKSGVTPDSVYHDMWQTISSGGEFECELQNRKKNGDLYWEHMRVSGVSNPVTGEVTHYLGIKVDVSERKRAELALIESESRFRLLAENATDVICRLSPDAMILYASPSATSMLELDADAIVGQCLFDVVVIDSAGHARRNFDAQVGQDELFRLEHHYTRPSGETIWIETSFKPVYVDGQLHEVHASCREITKRKRAFDMLHFNAYNDKHTGLPNRLFFIECLSQAVERHRRDPAFQFAVLLLDLDQFKVVNDSLGHRFGDTLLQQVGQLLKRHIRGVDTLAYLTGDEFAILLEDIADAAGAIGFAERIQQLFHQPFHVEGADIYISVSIGVVFCDAEFDAADHYLRSADTAMYQAKSQGKSRLTIFESPMHEQAMHKFSMQRDLRRCLGRSELRLLYQPIFRLRDRELIGLEALLRWHHAELGVVSPLEFIDLAEETELIVPIGEWVLREACAQLARLQTEYAPCLTMNVNVSSIQFLDPNFAPMVCDLVQEFDVDPQTLRLEITESLLMQRSLQMTESIETLTSAGIKLVMDDFGTGFSSLAYLQTFPIDTIKIDRAFVARLDAGEQAEAVVKTIISLANNFHMSIVAEGIETEAHVQRLRAMGCQTGQGYHLSRPITLDEVRGLLSQSGELQRAAR